MIRQCDDRIEKEKEYFGIWGFSLLRSQKKIEKLECLQKFCISRLISALETHHRETFFEIMTWNNHKVEPTILKDKRPSVMNI